MGKLADALAAGFVIVLVIIGLWLIIAPLTMSSSNDLLTKIEGYIAAPLLIPVGAGLLAAATSIVIALLKRSRA
jgi:hypothetical protein